MKTNKLHITVCFLILAFLIVSCGPQKSAWKGTISTDNGITIVKNPKTPLYEEEIITMEEVLSIGKSEGKDEYLFAQLRDLAVDDAGNIYTLDMKEASVKKFSAAGELLTSFGKKGQGPGEIGLGANLEITSQREIVIEDPMNRRLAYFSFDGDFIKNQLITKMRLITIECDEEGNIIGGTVNMEKQAYEVIKISPEIDLLCTYGSSPFPSNPRIHNPFRPVLRWTVLPDDTVACGDGKDYNLDIYDPQGKMTKRITKDYSPVEITEEEIAEKKKMDLQGRELDIPSHHGPYFWFTADNAGRIYVRTFEQASDGSGYQYNIFDEDGKYITDLLIPELPRVIKNDHIYTIEEDLEGYHIVKKYRLNWKI